MDNIYKNGTYLEENPTWHAEDSLWKAEQILHIMSRNDINPKTICEVGCGAGEILHQLYRRLPEDVVFSGYEISPQAFKLCRKKIKDRLKFYLKDILEDTDVYFDVILCIDLFEHIEDYLGFLKKIKEKSDYTVFHIPLDISVNKVLFRRLIKRREKFGHIHYFTKETALASLKDAGYEIIDYTYTHEGPVFLEQGLGAFLLKYVRNLFYLIHKDLTATILGDYSLLVLAK